MKLFEDEISVVHGGWTLDVLLLYSSVGRTLILEVEFGNLLIFGVVTSELVGD